MLGVARPEGLDFAVPNLFRSIPYVFTPCSSRSQYIPNCTTLYPFTFSMCSHQVPNVFLPYSSRSQYVPNSNTLYPIVFAQSWTIISGPKGGISMVFILGIQTSVCCYWSVGILNFQTFLLLSKYGFRYSMSCRKGLSNYYLHKKLVLLKQQWGIQFLTEINYFKSSECCFCQENKHVGVFVFIKWWHQESPLFIFFLKDCDDSNPFLQFIITA